MDAWSYVYIFEQACHFEIGKIFEENLNCAIDVHMNSLHHCMLNEAHNVYNLTGISEINMLSQKLLINYRKRV